ncbi:MAG: PDZ domain-containing protein [Dehalococcoidia bacterium]|nr:PDZ domain-containing protein [Dehalococcoidia bacterium]HRC62937.1 S41 family peptidase [Dehalococcoidia bacterium]
MGQNGLRNVLLAVVSVLIASMLFAVGFLTRVVVEPDHNDSTPASTSSAKTLETGDVDPSVLQDIIAILQQDFVDQSRVADPNLLYQGAIQGIFTQLNDPHSTYIDPKTYALSKDDFSGAFQGIGATVAKEGDYVVIVRPLADTPAARAGIQGGDRVLAVNGEDATGWSVEKAVLKIRGPKGSTVELKLQHADGSQQTYKLTRDDVLVASVDTRPPGGTLKDASGAEAGDIAYIRISSFTSRTPNELQTEIRNALNRNVKGFIIDVRGNPGGLLNETLQIADMFLDKGAMLTQVDKDGKEQRFDARAGTLTNLPIAIVQDEFSASGSEVLAAALQENGRATVVGSRSFGKGTVNHVRELKNGGAVYVSIARWLTPNRNQIEGAGVNPNILVTLTPDDIDQQRDIAVFRAIDALRNPTPQATR